MIDKSQFTRRFLRQFGLILVWLILSTAANPSPKTPTAITVILALAGIATLIGIIPGSYFSGLIDKTSDHAENASLNALVFLALLMPILFAVMQGVWAYDSYEMLTSSLPEEAIRELGLRYDFWLNLIGFMLPCILLISNTAFLIRKRSRTIIDS